MLLLQLLNVANHQEELQLPYELKKYERGSDQRAPAALLAISPLGKSPVITDDNVTLAESGAIVGEPYFIYDRDMSDMFVRISHHEVRQWKGGSSRIWVYR